MIMGLSTRAPLAGRYAAVAQLDRVFGYEPKGRGFESLQPYHVGAKYALLRRLFMPVAKKMSSARSFAPPLQTGPAGCRIFFGNKTQLAAGGRSLAARFFFPCSTFKNRQAPWGVCLFFDSFRHPGRGAGRAAGLTLPSGRVPAFLAGREKFFRKIQENFIPRPCFHVANPGGISYNKL